MNQLGISEQDKTVYEGDRMGHRVQPMPVLTPLRLFYGAEIPPLEDILGLPRVIFREDDFDSVTKVRRGRVYDASIMSHQPQEWYVHDPLLTQVREERWGDGMARKIRAVTYRRERLHALANRPAHTNPTVVLGKEPHLTFWKIISIENDLYGEPVLTLRARHSYGDTPELIVGNVPEDILTPLTEALDKVEASANRLSPAEVIDRCRDALSIVFGYQAGDRSKDLGDAIKGYLNQKNPGKNEPADLRSHCGHAVRLLHAQAKPNVQHEKGLRPPVDADADLALSCLKTVLIDFGWAR